MQNPQTAMQHMFGNDPKFQQAMKMAQGKTPDQLKETALNLAKTQGIDPKQIMVLNVSDLTVGIYIL